MILFERASAMTTDFPSRPRSSVVSQLSGCLPSNENHLSFALITQIGVGVFSASSYGKRR